MHAGGAINTAKLPQRALPTGAAKAHAPSTKSPPQQQQQEAQGAALAAQAAARAPETPAPSTKQQTKQQQKNSPQKAQTPPHPQERSRQAERNVRQGVRLKGSGGSPELWEADMDAEALRARLSAALGVFQQGCLDVRIFME